MGNCEGPTLLLIVIFNHIFRAILIITPILMIVMGSIELIKAVIAGDDKEIKKAGTNFARKMVFGVAVFLVSWLVKWIITKINGEPLFFSCWESNKDKKIVDILTV